MMRTGSASLFGVDDNGKARLHNERQKREPNRYYCVCAGKERPQDAGQPTIPLSNRTWLISGIRRDTRRRHVHTEIKKRHVRTSKICGQEG
jgi:hypothetical protein